MPVALSAEERNAINRAFWQERQPRFELQLSDKLLLNTALKRLSYEQLRGIPIAQQSTLEYELDVAEQLQNQALSERAELLKKQALSEQAARGGRADKRDALGLYIEGRLSRDPNLTVDQLHAFLKQDAPGDLIVDFDEKLGQIEFHTGRGERTKTAKISGLKHRLSRAKIKNRSR